jgi:hypothetical protein
MFNFFSLRRVLSSLPSQELIVMPLTDETLSQTLKNLRVADEISAENVLVVYMGDGDIPSELNESSRNVVRGSTNFDDIFQTAQRELAGRPIAAAISPLVERTGGHFTALVRDSNSFTMSEFLAERHRFVTNIFGMWITPPADLMSTFNAWVAAKVAA